MKKAFVAMLAAGAFAAAAVTASTPAQAGNNTGAIVAAGIGGLALGTIIGANAAARPVYVYPAYQPVPGYVVYTGYAGRVPVACPGGHWARKAVAFDRAGRPVAWSKPRWFCP